MSVVLRKTVECAACGGPVIRPVGITKDFCSIPCYRAGRTFCKTCGKPLIQYEDEWPKRNFCDEACYKKYSTVGSNVSPSYLAERYRTTCLMCGNSITQPKGGGKKYCGTRCRDKYRDWRKKTIKPGDILQEYGTFEPETRKVLLELHNLHLDGTAKRLATAIDREYIRRRKDSPDLPGNYSIHICKTCGKEFRRRPNSQLSKEYCDDKCHPPRIRGPETKLTWEEADDIRRLFSEEYFSTRELAEKYHVHRNTIQRIVRYKIYKPEDDPRSEGYQGKPRTIFTWEIIDEIRRLFTVEHLSQRAIAEKYGVDSGNISRIVHFKTWKPEHDPRQK